MDDDLVNHDLGKYWRGERHQLDRKRREQHIAPDCPVPQQFGDEPAEAEFAGRSCSSILSLQLRRGRREKQRCTGIAGIELLQSDRDGLLTLFVEQQHPLPVATKDKRGTVRCVWLFCTLLRLILRSLCWLENCQARQ